MTLVIEVAKKKKKNEMSSEVEFNTSVKNVIIVSLVVVVVLGVFYLLTVELTNDDTADNSNASQQTSIQTEEILAGSSFNRTDDEYLVVYFDKSDSDLYSNLGSVISTYKSKDERIPLYMVDMSSTFNKGYITEEEVNQNPTSIEELKINGPTLIKFNNNSVTEYVQGEEAITNYLQ